MLLRIADRGATAPLPVTGLRSELRTLLCVGFRPIRSTLQHRARRHPSLLWLLSFALTLCPPFAGASSGAQAKFTSASAWDLAKSDPRALVQAALENEIDNSYGHRPPVRYLLRKITRNTDTTKQIVETRDGGVARLTAIGNKPLTVAQQHAEIERLRELSADPAIEAHRQRSEQRDAARISGVMRLLPGAFLYKLTTPVEASTGLIHLNFAPNPRFSPPTLESRILTGIHGDVWIDPEDLRVVRIEGRLFRTVDYGWGLLGALYPGGTIRIAQTRTTDCGWQLSHLEMDLAGKELVFKPLHIVVDETATDYRSVPAGWKYTDAVQWLLHMPSTPTTQVDP